MQRMQSPRSCVLSPNQVAGQVIQDDFYNFLFL